MDKSTKHRIQTYSESKKSFFHNFFKKITLDARNKFFEYFKNSTEYNHDKSILDIGTTPSLDEEQNVILTKTINNKNITCISNQDCQILSQKYHHIKEFVIGNAVKMNFQNDTFDIVHTNATIEHVGSYQNQISLIRETVRVSKKYVFIQTPNRFYPIDFHTTLPLIHYLPKKIHRKILKFLGLNFYASEENLNLLSEKNLKNMCKELNLKKFKIIKHKLLFLTSNLILIIEK
jgi:ubiquinone/menaquinone biosynthesis C-methylase UbiE